MCNHSAGFSAAAAIQFDLQLVRAENCMFNGEYEQCYSLYLGLSLETVLRL